MENCEVGRKKKEESKQEIKIAGIPFFSYMKFNFNSPAFF
jgi:hypothetical protein